MKESLMLHIIDKYQITKEFSSVFIMCYEGYNFLLNYKAHFKE